MKKEEMNHHLDALLGVIGGEKLSAQERTLQAMAALDLNPGETLELRIQSKQFCDPADLARRAANAMFSRLCIYPTSVAVHSTIATLLVANEVVIRVRATNDLLRKAHEAAYGKEFLDKPICIEVDNSLDTKTAAARFRVDLDNKEYQEAMQTMIMRLIKGE